MPYIHKLYVVDYSTGKIRRLNEKCPRCGCFMAKHTQGPKPRWTCGKCHFTKFITTQPTKKTK
jgi:SSU ribosomal protein S27AE